MCLADLGFAPSSILLIRFVDEAWNRTLLRPLFYLLVQLTCAHLLDPGVPPPLDPSVLSVIEDYPTPPSFERDPPPAKASSSSSSMKPHNLFGKSEDGERKLPKWLKLGPSACPLIISLTFN